MKNSTDNQLKWFLTPVFVITYALALIAYLAGGLDKFPLGISSMFVPAIVAIIVHKLIGRHPILKGGLLGIRFGDWRYYLLGVFTFFVLSSLGYILTFLIFPDTLLSEGTIQEGINKSLSNLGMSGQTFTVSLLILFAMNILLAPILNIFMFLGEELGWRAFMTPRLLEKFQKNGIILAGIIWAVWHIPGIFLGLNYPGNPIFGSIIFIVWCIFASILLQYFYHKSGSVFCVAICHGVINWTATTMMMFFVNGENWNYILYGGPGIIGTLIFGLASIYFYRKLKTQVTEKNHSIT